MPQLRNGPIILRPPDPGLIERLWCDPKFWSSILAFSASPTRLTPELGESMQVGIRYSNSGISATFKFSVMNMSFGRVVVS